MASFDDDLHHCLRVLKSGGTILYPTDTIWGIGCDATNEEAIKKVYAIKQRSHSKAMIVLTDGENKLHDYLEEIPSQLGKLISNATNPLTIIYPKAKGLALNLIAPDGSIAIRIVKDEFCKMLIREYGKPIVSTSANISGENFSGLFSGVSDAIRNAVDYVVLFRQYDTSVSKPSSIVRLGLDGEIEIIRE